MVVTNFLLRGEIVIEKIGLQTAIAPTGRLERGDQLGQSITIDASKSAQSPDKRRLSKAHAEFTALVLQSFLEAAVPKNITGSEGPAAANSMWRSLLVSQLAKSVAESGQINVLNETTDQLPTAPKKAE